MAQQNLITAIRALADATQEEKEALVEILDVEGFGGREDLTMASAEEVAADRLQWLRDCR